MTAIDWTPSPTDPKHLNGNDGYLVIIYSRSPCHVCHGVDLLGRPAVIGKVRSVEAAKRLAERHVREKAR